MELWIPLISEYGFPVMITLYLLHRIEVKLDTLNDSIKSLAHSLQKPSESKHMKTQKASS
ncbi:YvrJ family protein [Anaerobacillus isosaccharinicus]|uniref:YvrJ family protein n=1 Tax=Anaerobacillus isosaccharinicus TaxID=1532552 RepID=A0A1S2LLP3_9BACI|nr:YvrJ family protein [Anaerobacillus isosaccharinicus]MBA5588327.1 YvrJ family protein [Anaerobacillus isosaccharinicus]QOY38238.1 YvrJ family protein [Anaerobacillus isosaccharinicus]